MNKNMRNKSKFKISYKMILTIFLLSIFICVASCFAGYDQYSDTITRLYNQHGYVIAEIINDHIDGDKIAKYVKSWEADADYNRLKEYLDDVYRATDAAFIFISVPYEDGTIQYVYDSGDAEIPPYGFGDHPNDKIMFQDIIMNIYLNGEPVKDNYFLRKSPKYGKMTSSILPIKDSNGETVALLSVDIAMSLIESTLFNYIIRTIIISVLLMIIFAIISFLYMRKAVVKPIQTIEKNLLWFADNRECVSEELNNIKTNDEIEDLSKTIYKMEGSILEYIDNITKITAEKERIGAELNVATQIQANMLPNVFPPFPDIKQFDLYASMNPAKEVGGDFYDFFMIDDNNLGIVMADVSGKGVPAALFMVTSKTLIKNRALMGGTPAEILEHVNNQLCENNKLQMFVTCWLGILNLETGIITAANAGHEFPSVKHAGGKYELVKDKHGFVLAGMEGIRYKDYTIELSEGDSLYIYTDGVPEATNLNNELFGTDRMLNSLNIDPDADCKKVLENVQTEIDKFVIDADQFDDITMLCLNYYGKGGN